LVCIQWYFAGVFSVLFFDFFLTLVDEVELVWKGKKGTKPLLPYGMVHNHCFRCSRPSHGKLSCNRFAIVEWLQTLLIVVPAEIVLLLRIYALTNKNKYVTALLASVILAQCIIVFYAMSLPGTNGALVLPNVPIDSFRVCILFSRPQMDTAYLCLAIAFDCIVVAITLATTTAKHASRRTTRSWSILQTIRWDGALYFCVILSGNVVWMALALDARPGLKFMNAQYVLPSSVFSCNINEFGRPSM
ncbi:hypothetical protein C8R45DRAFT_825175, partial [Mycena sanguinolenta]